MSPGFASEGQLTLDDLFLEYETPLRRYALSLVRDPDLADDLVQETMIRALGNLGLLGQLVSFKRKAWLYRVLKNLFLDGERAYARQGRLFEVLTAQTLSDDALSPAAAARGLIAQVPEQYRLVLTEFYLAGKPTEEIAREHGLPAATVRSRLFLARKWLRAHKSNFI